MAEVEQVDDRMMGGGVLSHQEPRLVDEGVYDTAVAIFYARVNFCTTYWAAVVLFQPVSDALLAEDVGSV